MDLNNLLFHHQIACMTVAGQVEAGSCVAREALRFVGSSRGHFGPDATLASLAATEFHVLTGRGPVAT